MSKPIESGTPELVAADEAALLARLDRALLPRHVAIIMDGNGRWARDHGLPRVAGHRAGIASVREVVESAARLGLQALTLYAFSRENWSRPSAEVSTLMTLLCDYLERELDAVHEQNIRFNAIGRIDELPAKVRAELARAEERTQRNSGMRFLVALSYSGRTEIADAARQLARDAVAGRIDPEAIDEAALAARLSTADLPDPDLLIRTSGELRVSNFLLWQIAYAEFWVTPVLWPDFRRQHLFAALVDYAQRERRFGGVGKPESRALGALRRLLS